MIVPTYNRVDLLQRLLDALFEQDFPAHDFEIVVVDDGSSDGTATYLQECARQRPQLRFLCQSNRGPAAARNRAIGESRGDWVVMTDDDTVPEPYWLSAVARAIEEHPEWVGVEGETVCPDPDPWGHWVENLRGGQYITANMAYPRQLLRDLGGFDESFPHPKCEDTELAWRCLQHGPIGFYPDMRILHPSRPQSWTTSVRQARYELSEFRLYARMGPDYAKFRRLGHPWLMIALIYLVVPFFRAWRFRRQLGQRPRAAFSFFTAQLVKPLCFLYYWLAQDRP